MTTKSKNSRETKKPSLYAYHVTEPKAEGQKGRWNRIGSYFPHADGVGGTLVLDLLPIGFNGRVVLRAPKGRILDLSYSADILIERLNASLGRGAIARLRFEPGELSDVSGSLLRDVGRAAQRPSPPRDVEARLDRIADPGLRDALARLGGYRSSGS